MKATLSAAVVLLSTLASARPQELNDPWAFLRNGDFSGTLSAWDMVAGVATADEPCIAAGAMSQCQIIGGVNNAGYYYQGAYQAGTQVFSQADSDVVKCLLDLHFRQKDACISVKGSKCDNGYLAKGGRVQQVELGSYGSSGNSKYQLDQYDSAAMQAATERLIGKSMATDHEYGVVVAALRQQNYMGADYGIIKYVGQNEC